MWHINLVTNTVKINKKIALELSKCGADICYDWTEDGHLTNENEIINNIIDEKGLLIFYPDHFEHMDFIWQSEIQKVLNKNKVSGDICFTSNEGDNKGQSWGYRFDGKGKMIELIGKLSFKPGQS